MNQYRKVSFYTLGCKLNFSETSTIARQFVEAGYARVDFFDRPDYYVINTCSVTDNADKKCRQLVRRALKVNPDARIVIIGCYAQLKPQEIAQIDGVDLVLGANEKFNVIEHLENLADNQKGQIEASEIKQVKEFIPSFSYGDRTRSFLKVQDGCDYFCSFCTIPLARGFSRSHTVQETIKVAREVANTSVKEVVLTGVNIGDFGSGTNENFLDLIRELDEVEGIDRYRISSIEPNLLSDAIIDFVSVSKRFAPHFHVPLQSGSDKILKLMRRRYERSLYADRVARIKQRMPDACIGVDVIVGFPDETDEDFLDTYEFINSLDISYLHVFTYSERDNTTAVRMKEVVPADVRNKRSKMLHILSEKKKRAFYATQTGKVVRVLFEAEEEEGMMFGFSENYVKVKLPFDPTLVNRFADVRLSAIDRDGVMKTEVLSVVPEIPIAI
ncbi:MAG TPA: tRNA (N(6)-L-threonylcarbamoyladenosine(37)-C(2))-methylthiotransferase MtaB [Flavobacteriales bacterium]|nr:tRNA (N(6)-L-threonylcarbamoyladenosine(37)-C(2))-methylthiotransferase MtaB [Flavobacteriales bacterium]HRE96086.1 tRNA (N(6)-L-threonylcarbamoyladenosine(37)-C(2))-methylthiotransferase MtaB [Flavobacteriales bacterium]HRJ36620.1 tRNA (N(6)-L-threonylcarbamoyladenosine(37)-C(2))-methylthiotransferase MtaB [Flavobacteriales bacterium]HRJ37446.1 tRNA (N(6)-L-threonylcarbamoyladenosine(37)-C(2))-methylthiotransferase MtaB [Flavobacteriales bacterium]